MKLEPGAPRKTGYRPSPLKRGRREKGRGLRRVTLVSERELTVLSIKLARMKGVQIGNPGVA